MRKLALVCAAWLSIASSAHATVAGQVTLDQVYPDLNTVPLSLGTATISNGVEFQGYGPGDWNFDIAPNGVVTMTQNWYCFFNAPICTLGYTDSAFNGFRLTFPDLQPSIRGLDLLSTTGFTSFGASRLSFTGNQVFVSLGGIQETFTSGTNFGTSFRIRVPEPGTLALFALGLLGLGVSGRRRAP